MCESNVFALRNGKEEMVMENVASITPQQDGLLLVDLFGESKLVRASIREVRLMEHKIYISES